MVVEVHVEDDGLLAVAVFGLDQALLVQIFDELFHIFPAGLLDLIVLGLFGSVYGQVGCDHV